MSGITVAATINLAQSTTSSSQTGQDTLSSIENAIGGLESDSITGSASDNRLDGSGGDDTINAGSDDDIIIGGAGNDTMNGQAGNDVFVFAAGFGNDKILQFDADPAGGRDHLDLTAFGTTGANFAATSRHFRRWCRYARHHRRQRRSNDPVGGDRRPSNRDGYRRLQTMTGQTRYDGQWRGFEFIFPPRELPDHSAFVGELRRLAIALSRLVIWQNAESKDLEQKLKNLFSRYLMLRWMW